MTPEARERLEGLIEVCRDREIPARDVVEEYERDDLAADLTATLARVGELEKGLETSRHALVCTHNYRATDLTLEAFDAHLFNGISRDRLEFMIDHNAEIAAIDALLTPAEAKS